MDTNESSTTEATFDATLLLHPEVPVENCRCIYHQAYAEIERLRAELDYVNAAWVKEAKAQQATIESLTSDVRHLQSCSGTCEDEMRKWKCRNGAHNR